MERKVELMREGFDVEHPLFKRYTRAWLHEVTGFSKGYLSRLATGKAPLTGRFIRRACRKLGEPPQALFLPSAIQPAKCHEPWGCPESKLGDWLKTRCRGEHLSLRQAAARADISHTTIADILHGGRPSAETIGKLAGAFAGDGQHQRSALEDELLALAGYRSTESMTKPLYLRVIPLLSPSNQHLVEVVVTELAKIQGIEPLYRMKTTETIM